MKCEQVLCPKPNLNNTIPLFLPPRDTVASSDSKVIQTNEMINNADQEKKLFTPKRVPKTASHLKGYLKTCKKLSYT